eukprot:209975-Chlamydomonas_euryale.AAC.1
MPAACRPPRASVEGIANQELGAQRGRGGAAALSEQVRDGYSAGMVVGECRCSGPSVMHQLAHARSVGGSSGIPGSIGGGTSIRLSAVPAPSASTPPPPPLQPPLRLLLPTCPST